MKWIGRGGTATTTRVEELACKDSMIEDIVERVVKKLQVTQSRPQNRPPSSNGEATRGRSCWISTLPLI